MLVSASSSSKRQSSTWWAFSEKIEKFVPSPSHIAPSGNGFPGQSLMPLAAFGFRPAEPGSAEG